LVEIKESTRRVTEVCLAKEATERAR
jgi:hypothetical protein